MSFLVVGPWTWNDLPEDVTSAESLMVYPPSVSNLKLICLPNHFSDFLDWTSLNLSLVDLAVVCIT